MASPTRYLIDWTSHLVQTFTLPSGWTLITLMLLWTFNLLSFCLILCFLAKYHFKTQNIPISIHCVLLTTFEWDVNHLTHCYQKNLTKHMNYFDERLKLKMQYFVQRMDSLKQVRLDLNLHIKWSHMVRDKMLEVRCFHLDLLVLKTTLSLEVDVLQILRWKPIIDLYENKNN